MAYTKPFATLLDSIKGLPVNEASAKFMAGCRRLGAEERIKNLYKVRHKDGSNVSFVPNSGQMKFWKSHTNRDLILKSRQIGFTTFACVVGYDMVVFEPGSHCGIMADKRERVKEIFAMVRRIHRLFIKDWASLVPLAADQNNQNEIAFHDRDSAMKVAYDFKGYTLKYLHISEAAFIDDKRITESTESIPDSGRIVMETTPNGMGGYYFHQYQGSMIGKGTYKSHFFPWFDHYPEHRIEVPENPNWSVREEEIRSLYTLDDQQMMWRRWKIEDMNGDEEEFNRLYPTDEISCFLSGRNQVFSQGVLNRLNKSKTDPAFKITLTEDGLQIKADDDELSDFWVWQKPQSGEVYAVGADPSEGIGKDYGGVCIIRCKTGRVVAEGQFQLEPDLFARWLYRVGKYYNNAHICCEVNNIGHAVLQTLVKLYGNLYKRRTIDERTAQPTKKVGFHTSRDTKVTVINNLKSALRDGLLASSSARFMQEATVYIREENGSYNAQAGAHDDLVMSYALAWEQARLIGDVSRAKEESLEDTMSINPYTGFLEHRAQEG